MRSNDKDFIKFQGSIILNKAASDILDIIGKDPEDISICLSVIDLTESLDPKSMLYGSAQFNLIGLATLVNRLANEIGADFDEVLDDLKDLNKTRKLISKIEKLSKKDSNEG